MTSLTIGTPVYDDYSGLEMTLQDLLLHHDLSDVELIVVDNHPTQDRDDAGRMVESKATQKIRQEAEAAGAKYIPMPEPRGTAAPRDRIFAEATSDVVIVVDSHVLLAGGALPAVRDYFADAAHAGDILAGPILSRRRIAGKSRLAPMATHYADVWRSEMWGIWSQAWQCSCGQWHFDVSALVPDEQQLGFDASGSIIATPPQTRHGPLCAFHEMRLGGRDQSVAACPVCGKGLPSDLPYSKHAEALEAAGYRRRCWDPADTEPFEIPGLGLGMFAARKDRWPGFPAGMIGFGGGELHLHELFRRRGGRAVCHPLAAWWHRFEREKPPYHAGLWEKVRNYVLWRQRMDWPLYPVRQHFVNNPKLEQSLNDAQWRHLLADPLKHSAWPGHLVEPEPKLPKGARPQPPKSAETAQQVYDWLLTTKRDCIDHLPAIRSLASKVGRVVSLVKRREWDAAVLAGSPAEYYSHNLEQDPLLDRLQGYTVRDAADSLAVDPIDCDLLIIDTVHSAERLRAELTRWAPACRRWIAIRGTKAFGDHAEGSKGKSPGLHAAIRELCERLPSWKRVYVDDRQYGLTVLSCDPDERTIDRGPGFELHRIFDQLGVEMQEGCACRARIAQMNTWGVEGCREHLEEIVSALGKDSAKYSWGTKLKAVFGTVTTGLAFRINPLDPLRSLVLEAIRRTEADDAAWEARS
jgi:hypothetical protein